MIRQWREAGIAADHPCLAGHFPGYPLVPGVVILERVLEGVAVHWGDAGIVVRSAKFLRPLPPRVDFEVRLEGPPAGPLQFTCRDAQGVLAEGRLVLEPVRDVRR